MVFNIHNKKNQLLIFSIIYSIIILSLIQNIKASSVYKLRNLLSEDKYFNRCNCTLKEFRNKYSNPAEEHKFNNSKYLDILNDIFFEENTKKITKYIPRVYAYLIVAIVGIILIILWIIFCCYCCKKVEKSNKIECCGKCSFIIFLFLSVGVIGLCVIGLISYPKFNKKMNGVACSVYKLVFHFLNGTDENDINEDWYGLNKIQDLLIKNKDNSFFDKNAENKVRSIVKTFEEVKNNKLNKIEKSMKSNDKLYPYNSIIIFGGVLLFNVLTLLIIFSIFVCDCKCTNCLFHLFWNIQMLLIIVTFFLSALIGSLSLVSKDLSNLLILKQKNITDYEGAFILNITENKDVINLCLNEGGNFYYYLFGNENVDIRGEDNKIVSGEELREKYFNCSFFKNDYNILVNELNDSVSKMFYFFSLLLIIIDIAGIISIFFGITVYNSQKEYYPPQADANIANVYNNRNLNNRADLSTENLKRQNNEFIFIKNIK